MEQKSPSGRMFASPRFLKALDLLLEAHVDELKQACSQDKPLTSTLTPTMLEEDSGLEDTIETCQTSSATSSIRKPAFVRKKRKTKSPEKQGSRAVLCEVDNADKRDIATGVDPGQDPLLQHPAGSTVEARPNGMPQTKDRNLLTKITDDDRSSDLKKRISESGARQSTANTNVMAGSQAKTGMFEAIKNGLADDQEVDEEEYDVSKYYHTEGIARTVAVNSTFGYLTLGVIAVNAVYMGIDADFNHADSLNDAEWHFIAMENFFCFFFTAEWAIRFAAFAKKANCLKDVWFRVDTLLACIMWLETWIFPLLVEITHLDTSAMSAGPLQLLRLLRLARLIRVLRAFPELVIMLKGMMVATRAVGSAMLLLVLAIYTWGIAMNSLLRDDDSVFEYWGTVTRCMMTLMANGTLGDSIGTVMRDIARNVPALIVMIAFVIFSMLTVLNMLVGVLCEVVTAVGQYEKDAIALSKLKQTMLFMLKAIDQNMDGMISQQELRLIVQDETALTVLEDLEIDVVHFLEITDMHYIEEGHMTVPQVMNLLLRHQGGRATTIEDLVALNKYHRWKINTMFKDFHLSTSHLMKEEMSSMITILRP